MTATDTHHCTLHTYAQAFCQKLLDVSPETRLGCGAEGAAQLKAHRRVTMATSCYSFAVTVVSCSCCYLSLLLWPALSSSTAVAVCTRLLATVQCACNGTLLLYAC
jgi:hypothetical protein